MSAGAGGGGGGACCACLSRGRALRRLRHLGHLAPVYTALVLTHDVRATYEHVSVCWECAALLKRVLEFQRRASYAQRVLTHTYLQGEKDPIKCTSMSNLNVSMKNTFDYVYTYEHHEGLGRDAAPMKMEEIVKEEQISGESDSGVTFSAENGACTQENNSRTARRSMIRLRIRTKLKSNTAETKSKTVRRTKRVKRAIKKVPPEKNYSLSDYETIKLSEEEMILYRRKRETREVFKCSKYKCESCILIFESIEHLADHNMTDHDTCIDSSQCDICQVHVPTNTMATHREGHYTHYKCVRCGHTDDTEDGIQWHLSQPHKSAHKCSECDIQFSSIKKLRYHKETVHSDPVMCEVCHREFKWKPNLEKHILQHTGGLPRLPCPVCGKTYAGKHGLHIHMKLHSRSDGLHRCNDCDIVFTNGYQLQVHFKNTKKHQGKKWYRHQCSECGKKFISETQLKAHVDYKHLGLLLFKCKICDRGFGTRTGVDRHVRSVHEGREAPRVCVCETCGQAFKTNRQLTHHRLIHTGERPYTCDVCGATFRQPGAMYTHKRLVHFKIKRNRTKAVTAESVDCA